MNLAIHTGNQALTHLGTEKFLASWHRLYDACPWATAFQHPDFVMPWYELYQDRFLQVAVLAVAEDASLAGLLTVAYHAEERKIVGAGERQAEYQTWLESTDAGCAFIRVAVKKLCEQFPGSDLCLKYLPAAAPLDWIGEERAHRKLFALRAHRRPLMQIDQAGMERQRRKKNHRQNFNRLKKSGDVRFEKIADHGRLLGIFDELRLQYDFRQGALHHYMPFASDPAKKPFYLELHRRGLLHTSVLIVGDTVAASHSGVISKGSAVHLGINTHAPALAAHSPGNLLLAMLGLHLVEENVAILDLTPGGDGYKEHFATEHDIVHELTVYGSMLRRWKKEAAVRAKHLLKSRMQKAGWSTADAWAALGKLKKFGRLGVRGMAASLRRKPSGAPGAPQRVYRYRPQSFPVLESQIEISKNSVRDILLFHDNDAMTARWEFMKTAMERMEISMDLYTHTDGERLLACCWVRREADGPETQPPAQEAAPAVRKIVLFDLQVWHGFDKNGMARRFLTQLLSNMKNELDCQSLYFTGATDSELHEAVLQCGFADESGGNAGPLRDPSSLGRDMQDISTGA